MQTLTSANFCIQFSRYNNVIVLAANIAQSFVVPAECSRVHFNMDPLGQTFWVDDQKTAEIPSSNVIDGTAPECNPDMRFVQPGQTLSCISGSAGKLSITCFKNR